MRFIDLEKLPEALRSSFLGNIRTRMVCSLFRAHRRTLVEFLPMTRASVATGAHFLFGR